MLLEIHITKTEFYFFIFQNMKLLVLWPLALSFQMFFLNGSNDEFLLLLELNEAVPKVSS